MIGSPALTEQTPHPHHTQHHLLLGLFACFDVQAGEQCGCTPGLSTSFGFQKLCLYSVVSVDPTIVQTGESPLQGLPAMSNQLGRLLANVQQRDRTSGAYVGLQAMIVMELDNKKTVDQLACFPLCIMELLPMVGAATPQCSRS